MAKRHADRRTIERRLRIAQRHVATGERLIDAQRAVLAQLARDGHRTETARRLLAHFEEIQAMYLAERDRLSRELPKMP